MSRAIDADAEFGGEMEQSRFSSSLQDRQELADHRHSRKAVKEREKKRKKKKYQATQPAGQ